MFYLDRILLPLSIRPTCRSEGRRCIIILEDCLRNSGRQLVAKKRVAVGRQRSRTKRRRAPCQGRLLGRAHRHNHQHETNRPFAKASTALFDGLVVDAAVADRSLAVCGLAKPGIFGRASSADTGSFATTVTILRRAFFSAKFRQARRARAFQHDNSNAV